jgi:hypothetical protein
MFTLSTSKDRGLIGRPCRAIGARIGKATATSTAKVSHSRSPLATVALSSLIMSHRPVGRSDKPFPVASSARLFRRELHDVLAIYVR